MVATEHETYTTSRFSVEVPGVREFQARYEQAVPANPEEEVAALVESGASWAKVLELHADRALHGFLIYWRYDVHPVMQLAGDNADCVAYLMGNVTIAEQMFRHDARAMLYAPLRTVIWEDPEGRAWFTVSQLCQRWQLGRKTIYKFIDNKILPAWKVGPHLYRIAVADVLRFEEQNRLPR